MAAREGNDGPQRVANDHPAAWLRQEPQGPWTPDWNWQHEPDPDRECHWWAKNGLEQIGPFDTREDAVGCCNALNALSALPQTGA